MLTLIGMGMEITSAAMDGDGDRVQQGRILILWGRGQMFIPMQGSTSRLISSHI